MSPREKQRLSLILKLNLAFLVGLAVVSLFLPLSSSQRWVLLPTIAVLSGFSVALLERLKG